MDATAKKKRTVHPIIKAWVAFHALMVILYSAPQPKPNETQEVDKHTPFENLVRPRAAFLVYAKEFSWYNGPDQLRRLPYLYMASTGLWQWWDMFAPNPASIDAWMDAEIQYEDGTTSIYQYPRIYDLPIWQKYFKERYRKYRERLTEDEYGWKWNHTAQRIALEAYRQTGRRPVEVQLYRHWQQGTGVGQPEPTTYNSYMFWDYQVDQIQLEADAK